MSRNSTRIHNIGLFRKCGWLQYSNTTVFKKGSLSLLSPAVNENTNGQYWFDVREVNLNRLGSNARLLIRIVPDMFVFVHLSEITELLSDRLKDNRPNSGNVWGLQLHLAVAKNATDLFNIKDTGLKIRLPLISRSKLEQVLIYDF